MTHLLFPLLSSLEPSSQGLSLGLSSKGCRSSSAALAILSRKTSAQGCAVGGRMATARRAKVANLAVRSLSSATLVVENSLEEDNFSNDYFHSPLVKMCGITSPQDASLAAQAGASYVGMIIWPHSKRSVSLSVAKEICAAAREFGAEPVGVFVSESASEIEKACDAAGISCAQLHGDGARASLLQLSRSLNSIYVLQSDTSGSLQTTISPEQGRVTDWILVDGLVGGSGSTFSWDSFKVPTVCKEKGWLLAGGLNPENVASAVSTLRPNAVDVASGIAGPDGIRKDHSRILAFMQAVRASSGSICVPVS